MSLSFPSIWVPGSSLILASFLIGKEAISSILLDQWVHYITCSFSEKGTFTGRGTKSLRRGGGGGGIGELQYIYIYIKKAQIAIQYDELTGRRGRRSVKSTGQGRMAK